MTEVVESKESEKKVGVTKWFDTEKGYGFIKLPSGELDIFVHSKQLRRSGIESPLLEGEKVEFEVDRGPKGAFATNIVKLKD